MTVPGGAAVIGAGGIKGRIPHRYPFLLVDRVVEVVPGQRLTARKAVTVNEPCYQDVPDTAGPEAYAYPVPLLIESWGQSGVLLAAWEQPNPDVRTGKVELAGAIKNMRFGVPVFPGDVIEHRVRAVRVVDDTAILEGETLRGADTVLSVGHFVVALRPLESLERAPALA